MRDARAVTVELAQQIRPLTADDVDAIVELNLLCDIAETGSPDHEIAAWMRDSMGEYIAFGIDDEHGLAACGWVDTDHEGSTGFEGDVRVRPGLDPKLGAPLLAVIRGEAAEREPTKPLHMFANVGADRVRAWIASHGGVEARHFWRMEIDFDDVTPTPPAAVPDDLAVRRLTDNEADLRAAFEIVDVAFLDHFGHEAGRTYEKWIGHMRRQSTFDPTLWWIAEVGGVPAAALLGWILPEAEYGTCGHVGTLGTLAEFRGRGLGTLLLQIAFAEFRTQGQRKATLGVDAANPTGAVRLYESVGMHAAHEWVMYSLAPQSQRQLAISQM